MVLRFAVSCLVISVACAQGQGPSMVASKSTPRILLAPELVCGPIVEDAWWSPAGTKIVFARMEFTSPQLELFNRMIETREQPKNAFKTSVSVFDLKTRKTFVLGTGERRPVNIEDLNWRSDDSSVYWIEYPRSEQGQPDDGAPKAVGFDFATGSRIQFEPTIGRPEFFMASPNGANVLLGVSTGDEEDSKEHLFLVHKGPRPAIRRLELGEYGVTSMWSRDGQQVAIVRFEAQANGRRRAIYSAYDLASGKLSEWNRPDEDEIPEAILEQQETKNLVLKESPVGPPEAGLALVTLGAKDAPEDAGFCIVEAGQRGRARIASNESHVLFIDSNTLFVRPLVAAPPEMLNQAKRAADQTTLVSNAKQCALGILLYANDYDDTLPPPGDFQKSVEPYIKNNAIMDGFVYTYNGPRNMADIKNPAETVLGYIEGPGGRAVAYADGHVKWIPNNPKG